ncbi:hypothetical protein L3i22_026660 [Actinoplanes sp. L3-i22]|nr:hypothetical protein L3i22_026660 [Actinoplanes sp. L3-i22]
MKTLTGARPARLDPPRTPPLPDPLPFAAAPRDHGRRRGFAALISAGALVAAAAVAVVVVDRKPSVEPARPLTASQLLLTAAERSSAEKPVTGKYLVVRIEYGTVMTVGAGTSTFQMTEKGVDQTWLSRTRSEPTRVTSQSLGMTPTTPADEAAWRAAGSPKKVLLGKPLPDGSVAEGEPVSIAGGKPHTGSAGYVDVYAVGGKTASVPYLEALPTEPEALRAALLKNFAVDGPGDLPDDPEQWLLVVASGLITDIPVSGPVRAAAFRLIATLPGVRSLGEVADRHGRRGQGFAYARTTRSGGEIEYRFVIDEATGRALGHEAVVLQPGGINARQAPGSLLGYSVVLDQRTTDEKPPSK